MKTIRPTPQNTPRRLLPAALLLFSCICHFAGYLDYPPGLGGDAARLAIHTWDFLQRGIWPFYIYHQDAPNPLIIFLQAPVFILAGFTPAALRGLTAFIAALLAPLAYIACRVLFARQDSRLATRAGVIAAAGLALSPFLQTFPRHANEVILFPVLTLLGVIWLWHGLERGMAGGFWLAGFVFGLSQYSYIVARILPLALAGACIAAWLVNRRLFANWRGWLSMATVALVVATPQILLFLAAPHTFFARTQQSAGQFVFGLPEPLPIFTAKLVNQLLMFGWQWDTGHHPFSGRPLLNPAFFLGLLVSLGALFARRRLSQVFLTVLVLLLLVPDLLAYEGLTPSANRLSGIYPFVYILAGLGCAQLWNWLEAPGRLAQWAGPLIITGVLGSLIESQWDFHARIIPTRLASDGLEWQTSLVEMAEAAYIDTHAAASILIPASEYQRAPLTFLLIDKYPRRSGSLPWPLTVGEAVTIILPAQPERPTTDGPPAGYIPDHWVLLKDGAVFFLPPAPSALTLSGQSEPIYAANRVLAATAAAGVWRGVEPEIESAPPAAFSNGVEVVGYSTTPLMPGQPVTVTIYLRSSRAPANDVQVLVQLLNQSGEPIALVHDWPLRGAYRVRAWPAGEVVPLSYMLTVPATASPGPYRLTVGLFDIVRNERLPALVGNEMVTVAKLKIALPASKNRPRTPVAASFGEAIDFTGYTLTQSGDGLTLALFWEAAATIDTDFTVFVHLVDEHGSIVGQSDSQPLGGQYPTSIWSAGESIEDHHSLKVPAGHYQVFVGLYNWVTGERLPVVSNQRVEDGRLWLGEVTLP